MPLIARQEIDEMLDRGEPFPDIEPHIENQQDLAEDARSALWLYAWVETDRSERRAAVNELLMGLRPRLT